MTGAQTDLKFSVNRTLLGDLECIISISVFNSKKSAQNRFDIILVYISLKFILVLAKNTPCWVDIYYSIVSPS